MLPFLPPLFGAFAGVYLGFWKNNNHKKNLDYDRKLFLLEYLRHEVGKGIELLKDRQGYLIPTDAWGSIVNSGNITLFNHDQTLFLGDIYFKIQNYNYEAKRTRDASEHFHILPEPFSKKATNPGSMQSLKIEFDSDAYGKAKKHWEDLSRNLFAATDYLIKDLQELQAKNWFNEKTKSRPRWRFWR